MAEITGADGITIEGSACTLTILMRFTGERWRNKAMNKIDCPGCDMTLEQVDTFGKIDGWNHILNVPELSHKGDIFFCEECQDWWYTLQGRIVNGYPC